MNLRSLVLKPLLLCKVFPNRNNMKVYFSTLLPCVRHTFGEIPDAEMPRTLKAYCIDCVGGAPGLLGSLLCFMKEAGGIKAHINIHILIRRECRTFNLRPSGLLFRAVGCVFYNQSTSVAAGGQDPNPTLTHILFQAAHAEPTLRSPPFKNASTFTLESLLSLFFNSSFIVPDLIFRWRQSAGGAFVHILPPVPAYIP